MTRRKLDLRRPTRLDIAHAQPVVRDDGHQPFPPASAPAVDDDARDRCRFLDRGDRRPREQYLDQEQACGANDGEHSQKCTVRLEAAPPTPANRGILGAVDHTETW